MTEISLEKLDALIAKAQELKTLLTETPIVDYLRLINEVDAEKLSPPRIDDVLIRTGEAAKLLGVSKYTIQQYAKKGKLKRYFLAHSNRWYFWRSEVKALAKLVKE